MLATFKDLSDAPGVDAVGVRWDNGNGAVFGEQRWAALLDASLQLVTLADSDVRVVVDPGEHEPSGVGEGVPYSIYVYRFPAVHVAVVVVTGHPIAKSLKRALTRLVRREVST